MVEKKKKRGRKEKKFNQGGLEGRVSFCHLVLGCGNVRTQSDPGEEAEECTGPGDSEQGGDSVRTEISKCPQPCHRV
jgi:hypothetical protein